MLSRDTVMRGWMARCGGGKSSHQFGGWTIPAIRESLNHSVQVRAPTQPSMSVRRLSMAPKSAITLAPVATCETVHLATWMSHPRPAVRPRKLSSAIASIT